MEYAYDANGNMVKDLDRNIVAIRYNLLNLPDTVQFANGNQIINRYDASGRKLGSRSMTLVTPLVAPVSEGTILGGVDVNAEDDVTASGTDYVGNVEYTVTRIYDFDVRERPVELYYFSRLYNPEGYVTSSTSGSSPLAPVYSYYSRDHLGNNREVWRAAYYRGTKYYAASVTQRTQYYPSGLPWSESLNPDIQKRKYNGKEFVETNGYDMYDYEARGMYPAIMRFTTVDPMAEKYYSISPYAYCGGNPVNAVDPDGMSMYSHNDVYNVDTSSKRVYVTKTDDPYDIVLVNGQNSVILPKGQVSENYYENLGYSVWPANPVGMEMTDLGLSLFMSEIAFAKASPYFGKLLTWLIGKPSITKASLLKVANELEKSGLSKVGRALKKHSDRIGSAFPKAVGNQGAINAQAEKVLKDILGNPSVTVTRRNARSVGEVLDYRIPGGIGARFSSDGKNFIGFLEPKKTL